MHPLIPFFDPIKFNLPFEIAGKTRAIHGFGILVALGFIFGAQMAMRKCKRDGLDPEVINRLLTWLVVGVFVGGHLGYALMYDPKSFLENPIQLLRVWEGLSSFGGFIACAALVWVFFKKEKLPFWPYADSLAYGLTLGWFLGRMGCFAAHDHPGMVSTFWLAVPGMCPSATGRPDPLVACHDMGLYEAFFSFGLMILFIIMERKPRFQGFYLGWLTTLYGPVRFVMDFVRHPDTDARYLGLTPAQYGSVVFTLLGAYLLYRQWNTTPVRELAPPPEAPSEKTPSPA